MRRAATARRQCGAGHLAAPQASRRFRIGTVVTIFRIGSAGPFIEGHGVIVKACSQAFFFRVQFDSKKGSRVRFVHPDWQQDPERSLALLRTFWEASLAPPSFDEFFPADPPGGDVP
ncbi:MAG TPA: hypothetical protein VNF29_02450 [Candidatus Binataceae bacterium]|nr:hypothetical protein [Candidatus Binataceae bacterium]